MSDSIVEISGDQKIHVVLIRESLRSFSVQILLEESFKRLRISRSNGNFSRSIKFHKTYAFKS